MTPRLKTQGPWTPVPQELVDQICEVFTDRFADEYDLEGHHFIVEGRIFAEEILLRVGLNNPNQLKQYNFELSVLYDREKQKALDVIRESMNTLEPSFIDLLEDGFEDSEFVRSWMAVKGAPFMAHLQYSTFNTELEKEADKLLNGFEKKLVYGDSEDATDDPLDEIIH